MGSKTDLTLKSCWKNMISYFSNVWNIFYASHVLTHDYLYGLSLQPP